ncbi:hypothetical protein J6590_072201 [Homalodisca vitripennis]|nr:hypothetical protein J6590_072201 [Homalodisca vitripennis]
MNSSLSPIIEVDYDQHRSMGEFALRILPSAAASQQGPSDLQQSILFLLQYKSIILPSYLQQSILSLLQYKSIILPEYLPPTEHIIFTAV